MSDHETSGSTPPNGAPGTVAGTGAPGASGPLSVANGMNLAVSMSEIAVTFTFMGAPTTTVILPPTVAKTLAQALADAVAELETKTGQSFRSFEEIRALTAEERP